MPGARSRSSIRYNTRAPAVALSCEDYGLVYRLTENNQGPKLRLNLDSELLPEQPVFNTVATIPGADKADEYVVLSAHFDSWDGSSGATDNGTGTLTMLEAARILKQVYPNPAARIVVGHWASEENGLVGSRAFTEDHPEVLKGLQALFNQDNGTGRVVRVGAAGLPDGAAHLSCWMARVPEVLRKQVNLPGPGFPSGGGSDDASFACHGLPAFGLGALGWDYGSYTWHTNRDTYDKIVFDDLKANATLTAMLVYMAADDSTTIARDRVDLVAAAAKAQSDTTIPAQFRRQIPTTWPECTTAPRVTKRAAQVGLASTCGPGGGPPGPPPFCPALPRFASAVVHAEWAGSPHGEHKEDERIEHHQFAAVLPPQDLPAAAGGIQKYATAISPEAMNAAQRVPKPMVISAPQINSILPAAPKRLIISTVPPSGPKPPSQPSIFCAP